MDPGLANAAGVAAWPSDVASADWVVLTGLWVGLAGAQRVDRTTGPTLPTRCIRDHFCEAGSYQDGLVALYHRCR